ncbi:hypothetical protein SK128_024724 [Halocaridina rubra]|uniref:Uncharacterized protein n=1 Tax=Halocaridina rubra TaxID=373956 RepID=A0AAN9ABN6_HALRR
MRKFISSSLSHIFASFELRRDLQDHFLWLLWRCWKSSALNVKTFCPGVDDMADFHCISHCYPRNRSSARLQAPQIRIPYLSLWSVSLTVKYLSRSVSLTVKYLSRTEEFWSYLGIQGWSLQLALLHGNKSRSAGKQGSVAIEMLNFRSVLKSCSLGHNRIRIIVGLLFKVSHGFVNLRESLQ